MACASCAFAAASAFCCLLNLGDGVVDERYEGHPGSWDGTDPFANLGF